MDTHTFQITNRWTGNLGQGTSSYLAYSRNHELSGAGKADVIAGSSDPSFNGVASRFNPEELLVASLSACHMLWLLHLCADVGIVVTAYEDAAVGTMVEHEDGRGEFTEVVLKPRMSITDPLRTAEATALHDKAHACCFIARSVRFPVRHEPEVSAGSLR